MVTGMQIKKIVSLIVLILVALGMVLFIARSRDGGNETTYEFEPYERNERNISYSITRFLAKPACYFNVLKSEDNIGDGTVESTIFVELVYDFSDKIVKGSYNNITIGKASKTGLISSYSSEPIYEDHESYTVKTFYEYTIEGAPHLEEVFFAMFQDEIGIATGEMVLNKEKSAYIYADPNKIEYTLRVPRIECKDVK